jgi:uncharacterized membrane protein YkvA (DUF1232 family)
LTALLGSLNTVDILGYHVVFVDVASKVAIVGFAYDIIVLTYVVDSSAGDLAFDGNWKKNVSLVSRTKNCNAYQSL